MDEGRQLTGEEDKLVRSVEVEAAVGLPQARNVIRPLQQARLKHKDSEKSGVVLFYNCVITIY